MCYKTGAGAVEECRHNVVSAEKSVEVVVGSHSAVAVEILICSFREGGELVVGPLAFTNEGIDILKLCVGGDSFVESNCGGSVLVVYVD